MKNIYTLSILLVLSLNSFAKSYFIYTAKKSGNWDNAGTWNVIVRNDNVAKDKFIIPAGLTVKADEDVNTLGYIDVELQISGELELGSSTTLYFGINSVIDVLSTGSISANGASQQIFIGAVSKYVGNKNKTLSGPLFADKSTGIAPAGFSAYSMLAVNFISFTATKNNDNTVAIKWSTSEEKNNNRFEIEQSINGNNWTKVATVVAVSNNSAVKAYSFNHYTTATGLISYRLKQIDNDGKFIYSTVVAIRDNNATTIANIYASNKNISVAFNAEIKSTVAVRVMNMNGDVVASQSFNKPSSKLTLNMNQLNNGIYVVAVIANNNTTVTKVAIN